MSDTRWLLRLAAASAIACVIAILWLDHPIAAWIATRETKPEAWNFTLSFFEYATGIEPWRWLGTVVLVAGTLLAWGAPRWRSAAKPWLFVLLAHSLAVNLMMWGKFTTGRLRPHEWKRGAEWFMHGGSFPSGHITLLGSIILPLAVLFPRGRIPCAIFLAFVGCARMAVSAHWLSDVLAGVALIAIVTWACARFVSRAAWPA